MGQCPSVEYEESLRCFHQNKANEGDNVDELPVASVFAFSNENQSFTPVSDGLKNISDQVDCYHDTKAQLEYLSLRLNNAKTVVSDFYESQVNSGENKSVSSRDVQSKSSKTDKVTTSKPGHRKQSSFTLPYSRPSDMEIIQSITTKSKSSNHQIILSKQRLAKSEINQKDDTRTTNESPRGEAEDMKQDRYTSHDIAVVVNDPMRADNETEKVSSQNKEHQSHSIYNDLGVYTGGDVEFVDVSSKDGDRLKTISVSLVPPAKSNSQCSHSSSKPASNANLLLKFGMDLPNDASISRPDRKTGTKKKLSLSIDSILSSDTESTDSESSASQTPKPPSNDFIEESKLDTETKQSLNIKTDVQDPITEETQISTKQKTHDLEIKVSMQSSQLDSLLNKDIFVSVNGGHVDDMSGLDFEERILTADYITKNNSHQTSFTERNNSSMNACLTPFLAGGDKNEVWNDIKDKLNLAYIESFKNGKSIPRKVLSQIKCGSPDTVRNEYPLPPRTPLDENNSLNLPRFDPIMAHRSHSSENSVKAGNECRYTSSLQSTESKDEHNEEMKITASMNKSKADTQPDPTPFENTPPNDAQRDPHKVEVDTSPLVSQDLGSDKISDSPASMKLRDVKNFEDVDCDASPAVMEVTLPQPTQSLSQNEDKSSNSSLEYTNKISQSTDSSSSNEKDTLSSTKGRHNVTSKPKRPKVSRHTLRSDKGFFKDNPPPPPPRENKLRQTASLNNLDSSKNRYTSLRRVNSTRSQQKNDENSIVIKSPNNQFTLASWDFENNLSSENPEEQCTSRKNRLMLNESRSVCSRERTSTVSCVEEQEHCTSRKDSLISNERSSVCSKERTSTVSCDGETYLRKADLDLITKLELERSNITSLDMPFSASQEFSSFKDEGEFPFSSLFQDNNGKIASFESDPQPKSLGFCDDENCSTQREMCILHEKSKDIIKESNIRDLTHDSNDSGKQKSDENKLFKNNNLDWDPFPNNTEMNRFGNIESESTNQHRVGTSKSNLKCTDDLPGCSFDEDYKFSLNTNFHTGYVADHETNSEAIVPSTSNMNSYIVANHNITTKFSDEVGMNMGGETEHNASEQGFDSKAYQDIPDFNKPYEFSSKTKPYALVNDNNSINKSLKDSTWEGKHRLPFGAGYPAQRETSSFQNSPWTEDALVEKRIVESMVHARESHPSKQSTPIQEPAVSSISDKIPSESYFYEIPQDYARPSCDRENVNIMTNYINSKTKLHTLNAKISVPDNVYTSNASACDISPMTSLAETPNNRKIQSSLTSYLSRRQRFSARTEAKSPMICASSSTGRSLQAQKLLGDIQTALDKMQSDLQKPAELKPRDNLIPVNTSHEPSQSLVSVQGAKTFLSEYSSRMDSPRVIQTKSLIGDMQTIVETINSNLKQSKDQTTNKTNARNVREHTHRENTKKVDLLGRCHNILESGKSYGSQSKRVAESSKDPANRHNEKTIGIPMANRRARAIVDRYGASSSPRYDSSELSVSALVNKSKPIEGICDELDATFSNNQLNCANKIGDDYRDDEEIYRNQ